MSTQNQIAKAGPQKMQVTLQMLQSAGGPKGLMELEAVERNWIATLMQTSGKPINDATETWAKARFEAEKILYLSAVQNNNQLQKADIFSHYTAITELAISGGTLRDGLCYIVPMGNKVQFIPGWKFRLEQINELPEVVFCHQPICVYDCDEFEFELGMEPKIIKHKPGKREKGNKITHVYFVIEFKHGSRVYIMDAQKVLSIRDNYSKSYQMYVDGLGKAGVEYGQSYKKNMGSYDITIEPPMWVRNEEEAFAKTIVKQVWKSLPKLPKHKWLDDTLKARKVDETDAEEMPIVPAQEADFSSFTEVVDVDTGEVVSGDNPTDPSPF